MLRVDEAAQRAFVQVVSELRTARRDARISQAALSSCVGVHGNRISDWENLRSDPTLVKLTRWSGGLDRCLVVTGPDGQMLLPDPMEVLLDEASDLFGLRRLARPLMSRRLTLGLSQRSLGRLVGVSGSSISYWELSRIPPRSIAQIVWARKLDCAIALRPKDLVLSETIRALTGTSTT